jgi:SAM-dependent methyltransferase
MQEYLASTYGDRIADHYDVLHPDADPAAIDLLAALAGAGPVLELGIGTGRLALPLVARGFSVHGVDASRAMVAKLREKQGGRDIPVTIADFRHFELPQSFQLIFVVFNTFFALQSQEEQVDCFRAAANHLEPDGCFLIEAFVPDVTRFDRDQRVSVRNVGTDAAILELSRHDPVQQRIESQILHVSEEGMILFPVQLRYAWPAELDLMARLAGLSLAQRWTDWQRQPFTASSTFHISVYRPT